MFHLVCCLYYCNCDARSHKHQIWWKFSIYLAESVVIILNKYQFAYNAATQIIWVKSSQHLENNSDRVLTRSGPLKFWNWCDNKNTTHIYCSRNILLTSHFLRHFTSCRFVNSYWPLEGWHFFHFWNQTVEEVSFRMKRPEFSKFWLLYLWNYIGLCNEVFPTPYEVWIKVDVCETVHH